MTKASSAVPKKTRRSSIFVALLFALIYIGQPALALVGMDSAVLPCKARGEACCCLTKVEVSEASCCSEEAPATEVPKSESRCDCRVGIPKVPTQTPALPVGEKDHAGENELTNWVRSYAELFSGIVSGPPAGRYATRQGGGAIGRLLSFGTARSRGSFFDSSVSSVGGWALLTRGVVGFLAVLSAARL